MGLCFMWASGLILYLPILAALQEYKTGTLGDAVNLSCSYNTKIHTRTTMCWGRGSCSNLQCNNVIIWTDGSTVTWKKSDRYQLLGDIAQGDVSLTITNVTEEDHGIYCCRVEIHGLFNDQIRDINLTVVDVPECPDDESEEDTAADSQSDL